MPDQSRGLDSLYRTAKERPPLTDDWLFCFHGRTFSSLRTRTLKRDGQKMVDLVLICLVLSVILHLREPWNAEDVTPGSVRGPLPEVTTAQYNNQLYIVQRVKLLKQLSLAPLNFANTVRPNWQISYWTCVFLPEVTTTQYNNRLYIVQRVKLLKQLWLAPTLFVQIDIFLTEHAGVFCLILSWVINRFTFSGPSWMVAVCNYWAHSVLIFFSCYLAQSIWRKQRPSPRLIPFHFGFQSSIPPSGLHSPSPSFLRP